MSVPVFSLSDMAEKVESLRKPWHINYLAMYSSIWGGIVTDPVLMTVPVDDHLVHRADAVFDVFKCVDGKAYSYREHMARLERSAKKIGLALPKDYRSIDEIIRTCVKIGGEKDVLVRIICSRGPGGFTTNPYECPETQFYVMIVRLKKLPQTHYENGISIISASVPVKHPQMATIKSCDYLGNVLVKKAAKEAGVEYAVSWDRDGYLTEGSTENIMLVSPEGELLIPSFDRVLKGITITRAAELAEKLIEEGLLKEIKTALITRDRAEQCVEVMLTGTSSDVLPVTAWDRRKIGDGLPGPVTRRLMELFHDDLTTNQDKLTDMLS